MINPTTLAHFTGSETMFRDRLTGILYTEGVKYVHDNGAAWLISDILVTIKMKANVSRQSFISIKATVKDRQCVVKYTDGDTTTLFTQKYDITDLNTDLSFFCTGGVLMLSREY